MGSAYATPTTKREGPDAISKSSSNTSLRRLEPDDFDRCVETKRAKLKAKQRVKSLRRAESLSSKAK
jgi:hypothetical protein